MLTKDTLSPSAPISVIIPCYNCANTLVACVKSVVNQTVLPAEMILIDDASSDLGNTKKIMEQLKVTYEHLLEIKTIFSASNNGPGTTKNIGWESAQHPYLAFLDSDDFWEPNKIQCQWSFIESQPLLTVVGANIRERTTCIENQSSTKYKQLKPRNLLVKNPYCNSSVVVAKNIAYRFEEKSYFAEDFMLWAKIICDNKYRAFYLPYRFSGQVITKEQRNRLSSNYINMFQGERRVLQYLSQKHFNLIIYYGAVCFSFFKLIRRYFKGLY